MQFDSEQLHALELVEKKENVLVTGGMGMGKSEVGKKIERWGHQENKDIACVAHSNTCNLGPKVGVHMIHSFFGLGHVATVGSAKAMSGHILDT